MGAFMYVTSWQSRAKRCEKVSVMEHPRCVTGFGCLGQFYGISLYNAMIKPQMAHLYSVSELDEPPKAALKTKFGTKRSNTLVP